MNPWTRCLLLLTLMAVAAAPASAERTWTASEATLTMSLDEDHLASFGLRVVESRPTGEDREVLAGLSDTRHAFAAADLEGLRFRSEGGRFAGFVGGRVELPFRGGLAIRAHHPVRGNALTPAFLYDFVVDIDPARGRDPIQLRSAAASAAPLQVRNASFSLDEEHGTLDLRMGDLQISSDWAEQLGQPNLANQWIGGLDLHLSGLAAHGRDLGVSPSNELPETEGTGQLPSLDVTLAELYGITSQGHIGTFPNGTAGLSAATTSCNTGSVVVPWNSPMAETHPFIALALFREQNGVLEMIGKNWIKHGFFALSNNQCDLGCQGTSGSTLGIGCSDTYSASNNGSRFYLGPREEIDPFAATWVACGSFFDEPVTPDPDCDRDYNGSEPNSVNHRLEVQDADLANPGATYYYEGEYFVADDTKPENNIGWRECTMSWAGSNWSFSTVGGGLSPNSGLLVETWGDVAKRVNVGPDDGEVVLSVSVTDIGGGQYHYEYVLYNWRSARAVHSISIPVGSATITNIGFHDIDQDSGNDWTSTLAGGVLTWATDDFATDPNANAVEYQSMYNFRFDADAPAILSEATGLPFRPGVGTEFTVSTSAPSAPVTGVTTLPSTRTGDLVLTAGEPNPFSQTTRLSFSLPSPQSARVTVHDIAGRTIRVLFDDAASSGRTELRWDGRDSGGADVASGVYFFRLQATDGARAVKGTLRR